VTQTPLWHADIAAAIADSGDNRIAIAVIGMLFFSLAGLTVSLVYDALRLLLGVKLMIAVVFLVGVPLTALVFAAARVL